MLSGHLGNAPKAAIFHLGNRHAGTDLTEWRKTEISATVFQDYFSICQINNHISNMASLVQVTLGKKTGMHALVKNKYT